VGTFWEGFESVSMEEGRKMSKDHPKNEIKTSEGRPPPSGSELSRENENISLHRCRIDKLLNDLETRLVVQFGRYIIP